MTIQESAEMYMETIYVLSEKLEHVRSIDISRKMDFSKASVSRAMKNLSNEGYIDIDENGYINLTEKGLKIAKKIYERHEVLTDCFISLGVDENIAEDDACRIEHVISDETFKAIKNMHNNQKAS